MSTRPSLEDQVIVALRRITRAIDLHSRGLMHQIGLTAPQLASLQAIGRMQPITVGALAKSIHLSQATLTGILTRLESRGLVSRARSGEDRRTVVVELTEEGRAVLESDPSLLRDRFRQELLKLHEWEQTQMLATLQRVASMMESEEFDSAPEEVEQFLTDSATLVEGDTTGPADAAGKSFGSNPLSDEPESESLLPSN